MPGRLSSDGRVLSSVRPLHLNPFTAGDVVKGSFSPQLASKGFKMNVLVVFAHNEPRSFNAAMKDAAAEYFQETDHNLILTGSALPAPVTCR